MQIEYVIEENETLRVLLGEEFTVTNAANLRSEVDEKIYDVNPRVLVIDFSKTKFADSSALGFVLGKREIMTMLGGKVRVISSPQLLKSFKLAGIDKVVHIEKG